MNKHAHSRKENLRVDLGPSEGCLLAVVVHCFLNQLQPCKLAESVLPQVAPERSVPVNINIRELT